MYKIKLNDTFTACETTLFWLVHVHIIYEYSMISQLIMFV